MRKLAKDHTMVLAAFRHSLGQPGYVAGCCIDWLDENWSKIDSHVRETILWEIKAAIATNLAGDDVYRRVWGLFLERHSATTVGRKSAT